MYLICIDSLDLNEGRDANASIAANNSNVIGEMSCPQWPMRKQP